MSIPIHEKIERIRAAVGLSQADFAELVGLSVNTLKAIVKRGSSPRFEVVEQIARRWPQYAYWLLTGQTMSPSHVSPLQADQLIYRVFDSANNPEPVVSELMVKPEFLTQLIFLQCIDEPNDLYCLIEAKAYTASQTKQCVLVSGNMNFCSDDKGALGLAKFAEFIERIGREDLVKSSHMKHVFSSDLEKLISSSEIAGEQLAEPDLGTAKWKMYVHLNFSKWRMDGARYEPTYSWRDMDF
ncbi:helix-turn-helix transcriptional regulator [Agaribacterium sp. ZY112]|uniref:helix-turn-helix transcriptional regulator n=1 Tax=Agaribacterium sp. ZY112 TaxID=3233574 RepID=UPI003526A1AA